MSDRKKTTFRLSMTSKRLLLILKKKKIICLIAISCVKLKLSNVSAALTTGAPGDAIWNTFITAATSPTVVSGGLQKARLGKVKDSRVKISDLSSLFMEENLQLLVHLLVGRIRENG